MKRLRSTCAVALAGTLFLTVSQDVALARTMTGSGANSAAPALDPQIAGRFARLALDCVHREYPNKIAHVLNGPDDARPPRDLTPAFFGCFDWHSAVHGHWLLARLVRLAGQGDFASEARRALDRSLTVEHIAAEVAYLEAPGRTTFERPYGLAWLLQLAAELREWSEESGDEEATRWVLALEPLEALAARRFTDWLPDLSYPIRTGEHSQTAFAFGLVLDWARTTNQSSLEGLLLSRIEDYYAGDRGCPLAYEPSGQDFLSPCLAEADLMRRIQTPEAFAAWLDRFLPDTARAGERSAEPWLTPVVVTDPTDGKLAHLDGLNLSRAWMLDGIASGLPAGDPRVEALRSTARRHAESGLESVAGEHYEGGHWLASFATYLVTERGIGASR